MAAKVVNVPAKTDFGDLDLTNVGSIALDEITSDADTSVTVTLGTEAGDDFIVGPSNKLVVEGDTGEVGISTATPRRKLDILDDTNPQLRLTHTDDDKYVEFQSQSTGDAAIKMSGTTMHLRSSTVNSVLMLQNATTGFTDGYDVDGFHIGAAGLVGYLRFRDPSSSLHIGCGDADAITIDAARNVTAIYNLTTNGNVTLGNAGGDVHTLNGTLQFAQEVDAPSAPAADEGGIFYVKEDGIPYFISDTTAETSLVGGGGGGGYTVEAKAANFNAVADYYYIIDSLTNTAAITVTLPNAGATASGTSIGFKARHGASYAVTLNRGEGGSIDGAASNLVLENDMAAVELICDGSNWWIKS